MRLCLDKPKHRFVLQCLVFTTSLTPRRKAKRQEGKAGFESPSTVTGFTKQVTSKIFDASKAQAIWKRIACSCGVCVPTTNPGNYYGSALKHHPDIFYTSYDLVPIRFSQNISKTHRKQQHRINDMHFLHLRFDNHAEWHYVSCVPKTRWNGIASAFAKKSLSSALRTFFVCTRKTHGGGIASTMGVLDILFHDIKKS